MQITAVKPYFTPAEYLLRPDEFSRQQRLSTFVFEAPFTAAGGTHGSTAEQWKRKVRGGGVRVCVTVCRGDL